MRWNSQVCERSLFYSLHLSLSLGNGLVEIKLEYLEQVYPLIYNHYLFSCYVGSRSCSADQFVGLWPCMEMWLFHLHLLEFWGIYNYICSCPSATPPPSLACQIVLALPLVGNNICKKQSCWLLNLFRREIIGYSWCILPPWHSCGLHYGNYLWPSHDLSATLGVFNDHSFQGPAFFFN